MSNRAKKNCMRLLRTITILLAILNIIGGLFTSKSYAAEGVFDIATIVGDTALGGVTALMTGIPLILLNVVKLLILVVGLVGQALISGAYISLENKTKWVGLEEIIFAGTSKRK